MITSNESRIARGRHNVYRFLAGAYLREPTKPVVKQICCQPFLRQLSDIFGPKNIYWLKEFSRSFDGDYDALVAEHRSLFSVPANRYITPYKAAYADLLPLQVPGGPRPPEAPTLRALKGFRADTGLGLTSLCDPLGKHLGHELEFMSRLSEEEALALAEDDEALASCYRHAERSFLERHLGRWIQRVVEKLQKKGVSHFYKGIGEITRAFVLSDLHDLQTSP